MGLDAGTTQWFLFLSTSVIATLVISVTILAHKAVSAQEDRHVQAAKVADAEARKAEANAKQADSVYQTALLQQVGVPPEISVNVPQSEIDRLAMDVLKQRLNAITLEVKL